LGPNQVGSWSVTVDAANAQPVSLNVLVDSIPDSMTQVICTVGCFPPAALVPPLGAASLDEALYRWSSNASTFYLSGINDVGTQAGLPLPALRTRFVDQNNPTRSVDIPVVLLSRLMSANLSTLDFAGVTQDRSAHSNLIIGNVQKADSSNGEDLPMFLELFDSDGIRLGSASLGLSYGETVLIGDIAAYLGSRPLSLGHLRITRNGGAALMWGILYTVDGNGAVTASVGANLSP
jgi:hypothetical protein